MLVDVSRPAKLHRYSERNWLERSLVLGEFRLVPASTYESLDGDLARQDNELTRTYRVDAERVLIRTDDGKEVVPLGEVVFGRSIHRDYLVACFSSQFDPAVGARFEDADSCLVIHDPESVMERLHDEIAKLYPEAVTMNAAVSYGHPSPLGVTFSKPEQLAYQTEYRFTVIMPDDRPLSPLVVSIGSIEGCAEIIPLNGVNVSSVNVGPEAPDSVRG